MRASCAERADVKYGGTFSDYLSQLRRAGLAEERDGLVYASKIIYTSLVSA